MTETTRIVTIQVTKIIKGNVEFIPREECKRNTQNLFRYCDDAVVTVQDFVNDDAKEENEG